jgi:hypothetical protein
MFKNEAVRPMNTAVLCAYWHKKPLSALQYIELLKRYVEGLEQPSSAFSQMFVLGRSKLDTQRLGSTLENAQQRILTSLPKEWVYLSADGKKIPASPESYSRNGFVNTLTTTLDYEVGGAMIETAMGSIDTESTSSVIVRLRGPELMNLEFMRKLFTHTVTHWQPAYACLEGADAAKRTSNFDEIPLGWLTYIATEKLPAPVPQGIQVERCGVGVLIEVPDAAASGHHAIYSERFRNLRELLHLSGMLIDPLVS